MRTILERLRVALVLVGAMAVLVVPTVWADSDHDNDGNHGNVTSGLASGTNVTVSGPGVNGTPNATVCTTRPGDYVGPLSGSNWISPRSDCGVNTSLPSGDYTYTTTFTLPSNLSGLALNGSVLADDSVTINLNGNQIFNGGNWTGATSFGTSSFFNQGATNTLQFVVHNANAGASGLDFVANVTANGQPVAGVSPHNGHGEGDEDQDEDEGGAHGECVSAVAHSHTTSGRN